MAKPQQGTLKGANLAALCLDHSASEIARLYGVSRQAVDAALRRRGLQAKRVRNRDEPTEGQWRVALATLQETHVVSRAVAASGITRDRIEHMKLTNWLPNGLYVPRRRLPLTDRESLALKLREEGKSSQEVSKILGATNASTIYSVIRKKGYHVESLVVTPSGGLFEEKQLQKALLDGERIDDARVRFGIGAQRARRLYDKLANDGRLPKRRPGAPKRRE